MSLKIINTSDWPTPALTVLVRWVCKREGLGTKKWPYTVTVRKEKNGRWHGHGSRYGQTIKVDRRASTGKFKDHRYKDSAEHETRSSMETLVYLLAHEAYHATGGHPEKYKAQVKLECTSCMGYGYFDRETNRPTIDRRGRKCLDCRGTGEVVRKSKRTDVKTMEWDCNHKGNLAVLAFREEWETIRPAIYAAMRADRARRRKRTDKRFDPTPKLMLAQESLDKWQRKLKLAQTKIKKYKRKVTYYTGKVAAKKDNDNASLAIAIALGNAKPQ